MQSDPHRLQFFRTTLSFLLALTLGGCASMDQSECETVNWYDKGVSDGIEGKASGRYRDYNNDCSEFGVQVDDHAYLSGWEIGIARYCTADNGYKVGLAGNGYENSCPPESADAFLSAYQLGQAISEQQTQVERLRYELEDLNDDLARSDISDERRRVLRRDRRHLRDDLDREEWELSSAKERARSHGFPAPF